MKKLTLVALLLIAGATAVQAQKVAVKTNLLYWATGTINLGIEPALGRKTTLDLEFAGNPWRFGKKELNRKIWHWTAQPELRFWFTERFNRGFMGIHATAGAFDAAGIELPLGIFSDLKDHRFEGWMTGIGVSYGWQWWVSPHWNFEATLGFGYLYMEYDRFVCNTCDFRDEENKVKHYFGPTKLGLSFSYLFGSKK